MNPVLETNNSDFPDTRVFYIDIGNTPPEDANAYLKGIATLIKRNPIINDSGFMFDPEDIIIPVRDQPTRVEVLPSNQTRVYYVNIQYMNPEDANGYLGKIRNSIKRKGFNDLVIPVRGDDLTRVEVLPTKSKSNDFDLIYVKADGGFYIMPRANNSPDSLQKIYELTQKGTSGLSNAIGFIPEKYMREFANQFLNKFEFSWK